MPVRFAGVLLALARIHKACGDLSGSINTTILVFQQVFGMYYV